MRVFYYILFAFGLFSKRNDRYLNGIKSTLKLGNYKIKSNRLILYETKKRIARGAILYNNHKRLFGEGMKKFKHLSNDFVSFDGFILTGKYEPVII